MTLDIMKPSASSETAIVRTEAPIEPWRDPEWQRLWLSVQSKPWSSLAIVPAADGGPADFALRIAVTLARTGMVHLGSPVQVADATKVPLAYLTQFLDEVGRCKHAGDRILVALAPLAKNPVTLSIAQAADAAVLCVLFERMSSAETKKTVAKVGFNRFVGSVIFRGTPSVTDLPMP